MTLFAIDCPLCNVAGRVVAVNRRAVAVRDGYPVSDGHTLVAPRRHVASWFELTPEERAAIIDLIDEVKRAIDTEFGPAGYNIGINDGAAAGQTVMHVHVHVIPRVEGDVDDPTGGVQFVIPERGNYRRPGHIPTARKE